MAMPDPPAVAGLRLDGTAPYVIGAEENRRLCAAVGCDPEPNGTAHPIYCYVATQVGMGLTVSQLCEVCDFDLDDGPMLAEVRVDFAQQLISDHPYRVRGEIVSLVRKASRRLGVMDLLEYRLSLTDAAGVEVLACTNRWVLPRGGLAV